MWIYHYPYVLWNSVWFNHDTAIIFNLCSYWDEETNQARVLLNVMINSRFILLIGRTTIIKFLLGYTTSSSYPLDSACYNHITHYPSFFSNVNSLHYPPTIHTVDGSTMSVCSIDTKHLKNNNESIFKNIVYKINKFLIEFDIKYIKGFKFIFIFIYFTFRLLKEFICGQGSSQFEMK